MHACLTQFELLSFWVYGKKQRLEKMGFRAGLSMVFRTYSFSTFPQHFRLLRSEVRIASVSRSFSFSFFCLKSSRTDCERTHFFAASAEGAQGRGL